MEEQWIAVSIPGAPALKGRECQDEYGFHSVLSDCLPSLLHLDNAPRETRRVLRPWMMRGHFWSCRFIHAHCMSNITIVLLLQGRREPGNDREGAALQLVT